MPDGQSLRRLVILFFEPLGLDFSLILHELPLEPRVRENDWPSLSCVRQSIKEGHLKILHQVGYYH